MPPKRATCPMPEMGEGSGQGSSDKTVERLNKTLEGMAAMEQQKEIKQQ